MDDKPINIDNELTILLKNGDIKAFEEIFHHFKSQLYFFSLGYLKSASESEEIIQNTFLSLWEHRESLIDSVSVKNYLYTIATNNIYNYLKHQAVKRKFLDFVSTTLSEEDNNTQQQLDFIGLEKTIESYINKLPDQTRQIFKLSRFDGLSYQEIALQLGISVRTVENLVYRALKSIRTNLKNDRLMVLLIILGVQS